MHVFKCGFVMICMEKRCAMFCSELFAWYCVLGHHQGLLGGFSQLGVLDGEFCDGERNVKKSG